MDFSPRNYHSPDVGLKIVTLVEATLVAALLVVLAVFFLLVP